MIRSWAYNRFGVLMGTSSRASCPRWPSLRGNSWPMITLFSSQGDFCATAIRALEKELRKHPSKTQDDPGYRRLRYIRYADDFLFGFAGPFEESHQIKDKVASFLQTELKLPLSAEKNADYACPHRQSA